jgi:hypothetical protein
MVDSIQGGVLEDENEEEKQGEEKFGNIFQIEVDLL